MEERRERQFQVEWTSWREGSCYLGHVRSYVISSVAWERQTPWLVEEQRTDLDGNGWLKNEAKEWLWASQVQPIKETLVRNQTCYVLEICFFSRPEQGPRVSIRCDFSSSLSKALTHCYLCHFTIYYQSFFVWMSFFNCPWFSLYPCWISSTLKHRKLIF